MSEGTNISSCSDSSELLICLFLMHYLFSFSPQQLSSLCLLCVIFFIAPDVLRCFWLGYSSLFGYHPLLFQMAVNVSSWLESLCVIADMCLSSSEGGEELQRRSKLLCLLDSVTDALVWAISKTGLSFQQRSTRLAHLLMLLSHIRHLRYKEYMQCFHSEKVACGLASYTVICLNTAVPVVHLFLK